MSPTLQDVPEQAGLQRNADQRRHEAQPAAPQRARLQQCRHGRRQQRRHRRTDHAEARPVADAQRQDVRQRHLGERGEQHVAAGCRRVAAAAQQRRQEEVGPDHQRAAEQHVAVDERVVQRRALAAQQPVERGQHRPGKQAEDQGEPSAQHQGMQHQRAGIGDPAAAHRAGHGGRHAAAHAAGGHHGHHHHERKNQREARQRRRAEPPEDEGLGDRRRRSAPPSRRWSGRPISTGSGRWARSAGDGTSRLPNFCAYAHYQGALLCHLTKPGVSH